MIDRQDEQIVFKYHSIHSVSYNGAFKRDAMHMSCKTHARHASELEDAQQTTAGKRVRHFSSIHFLSTVKIYMLANFADISLLGSSFGTFRSMEENGSRAFLEVQIKNAPSDPRGFSPEKSSIH